MKYYYWKSWGGGTDEASYTEDLSEFDNSFGGKLPNIFYKSQYANTIKKFGKYNTDSEDLFPRVRVYE